MSHRHRELRTAVLVPIAALGLAAAWIGLGPTPARAATITLDGTDFDAGSGLLTATLVWDFGAGAGGHGYATSGTQAASGWEFELVLDPVDANKMRFEVLALHGLPAQGLLLQGTRNDVVTAELECIDSDACNPDINVRVWATALMNGDPLRAHGGDTDRITSLTFRDDGVAGNGKLEVTLGLRHVVAAVPEPGVAGLVALGLAAGLGARRRRPGPS